MIEKGETFMSLLSKECGKLGENWTSTQFYPTPVGYDIYY